MNPDRTPVNHRSWSEGVNTGGDRTVTVTGGEWRSTLNIGSGQNFLQEIQNLATEGEIQPQRVSGIPG
jgi:hypothetical protein